mmetsp:Transcript_50706/g.99332  ORF Transcript_50706/g.99332 Transcript_50706/m.99332 type:complete len:292 (-) Transcript_50706:206-1081(-)
MRCGSFQHFRRMSSLSRTAEVIPPVGDHKHTIVWLHGLGDSSAGFRDLFQHRAWGVPNTKIVLANAPKIPVTINGNMVMPAWYDIYSMDRQNHMFGKNAEDEKTIEANSKQISLLLEEETKLVASSKHIMVGGFSQGGAMALRVGLSHSAPLGGILSCSAYLLLANTYPECINPSNVATPVWAYHGRADPTVPASWAQLGYDLLSKHGVKVSLTTENMDHSVSLTEVNEMAKFCKGAFGTTPSWEGPLQRAEDSDSEDEDKKAKKAAKKKPPANPTNPDESSDVSSITSSD